MLVQSPAKEKGFLCWKDERGKSVWPVKCRQMSIKVAQKWFNKEIKILTPLQKLPKNVWDWDL